MTAGFLASAVPKKTPARSGQFWSGRIRSNMLRLEAKVRHRGQHCVNGGWPEMRGTLVGAGACSVPNLIEHPAGERLFRLDSVSARTASMADASVCTMKCGKWADTAVRLSLARADRLPNLMISWRLFVVVAGLYADGAPLAGWGPVWARAVSQRPRVQKAGAQKETLNFSCQ